MIHITHSLIARLKYHGSLCTLGSRANEWQGLVKRKIGEYMFENLSVCEGQSQYRMDHTLSRHYLLRDCNGGGGGEILPLQTFPRKDSLGSVRITLIYTFNNDKIETNRRWTYSPVCFRIWLCWLKFFMTSHQIFSLYCRENLNFIKIYHNLS